jgi:hypothetical protein
MGIVIDMVIDLVWITSTYPKLNNSLGLDAFRKGKEQELVDLIIHMGETFC